MNPTHPVRRTRSRRSREAHPHALAKADGADAAGVNEFTQFALWMAASLAGLVTAVLVARKPFFEALAKKMGWTVRRSRGRAEPKPTGEQALPMLAEAVVGSSRSAVAAVFGPPRCGAAAASASTYWDCHTWYYPLPKGQHMAVAIRFEDDVASRVQFIQAPVME